MRAIYIILIFLAVSCKTETKKQEVKITKIPKAGEWRMEFDLGEEKLPVNLVINHKSETTFDITFINAEENILVEDIVCSGDSVYVQMPVFSSKFYLKTESKKLLTGYFIDLARKEPYKVPVKAQYGSTHRFVENNSAQSKDFNNKWEVSFSPDIPEDTWAAVGLFDLKNDTEVHGTFLTETGDFRFLEGNLYHDSLKLSCFDGAHLFVFTAKLKEDSLVGGKFYSGAHYSCNWIAKQNDNFELRDPNTITKVTGSEDWQNIVVKNLRNEEMTLGEISKDDKIKIIQILGSWCPNCMDETNYYKELCKTYPKDLQIIPVGFEKEGEGIESLTKMKLDMQLPYEVYLGGISNKEVAREVFPMLNKVISFPTSIFIDKNGEIRKVHTGFYGPGTDSFYKDYVNEMGTFIKELINE